jgi:hypothetical protein
MGEIMDLSKYREFYKTNWEPQTSLSDNQLNSYIMRACDNISNALFVLSVDNLSLPTAMNDTFCSAVCAEVDSIARTGNSGEADAEFDSIQIGSFRMSGIKQNSDTQSAAKSSGGICTRAEEYLAKTGLYSRRVAVI